MLSRNHLSVAIFRLHTRERRSRRVYSLQKTKRSKNLEIPDSCSRKRLVPDSELVTQLLIDSAVSRPQTEMVAELARSKEQRDPRFTCNIRLTRSVHRPRLLYHYLIPDL